MLCSQIGWSFVFCFREKCLSLHGILEHNRCPLWQQVCLFSVYTTSEYIIWCHYTYFVCVVVFQFFVQIKKTLTVLLKGKLSMSKAKHQTAFLWMLFTGLQDRMLLGTKISLRRFPKKIPSKDPVWKLQVTPPEWYWKFQMKQAPESRQPERKLQHGHQQTITPLGLKIKDLMSVKANSVYIILMNSQTQTYTSYHQAPLHRIPWK